MRQLFCFIAVTLAHVVHRETVTPVTVPDAWDELRTMQRSVDACPSNCGCRGQF